MPGSTIQSVRRAADIMQVLATEPRRYRPAELARMLGLAKGTVYGILRTLQQTGLVEQDAATGEYRLGAALLQLGGSYLDGNALRAHALGPAEALAARSGASDQVGMPHGGGVLIVHHVPRPTGSRQVPRVGALLTARAAALGMVLRTGEWATDTDHTAPGHASIAAPIRDGAGRPAGAIGVTGPTERLLDGDEPRGDLVSTVCAAARAVERDLASAAAPAPRRRSPPGRRRDHGQPMTVTAATAAGTAIDRTVLHRPPA
jgi:DNA-binding IclR family transcriptional regulator